jgi:hypothetical protein
MPVANSFWSSFDVYHDFPDPLALNVHMYTDDFHQWGL